MNNKKVIQVQSVMRDSFVVVEGLDTVSDALTTMRNAGASIAIVSKRYEHDEIGLVLLADIAKKVLAKNRSAQRVNVYEVMAKPVISVQPEMDIRYCARLFENFGLSCAPVLEGHEVVGVVSYNELVLEGLWPAVAED